MGLLLPAVSPFVSLWSNRDYEAAEQSNAPFNSGLHRPPRWVAIEETQKRRERWWGEHIKSQNVSLYFRWFLNKSACVILLLIHPLEAIRRMRLGKEDPITYWALTSMGKVYSIPSRRAPQIWWSEYFAAAAAFSPAFVLKAYSSLPSKSQAWQQQSTVILFCQLFFYWGY